MKQKHFVLALGLASLLVSGCSSDIPSESESSSSSKDPILETGYRIIQNGKSDYSIVIPSTADQTLQFAASEMQYFLSLSTGVSLPILKDDVVSYDATSTYISLGNTTLLADSGLSSRDDLGKTGYTLKTLSKSVFVISLTEDGVLSGVYDMLKESIGLEIYSYDEFDYRTGTDVPLYDFDISYKPLIDVRRMSYYNLQNNSTYNSRMKLFNKRHGYSEWLSWAHTVVTQYLPYSKYGKEHPDWYGASGTQICYSNPEVVDAIANAVKDLPSANDVGRYIMIGHEDNKNMCQCENCVNERKKFGNYAGQELNFTNKVAEKLESYMQENYPGRDITFVFFAYQTSAEPPVEYDTTLGKYVPIDRTLKMRKDVTALYCPIEMNFTEKLSSDLNAGILKQMQGWSDLLDYSDHERNLSVWTYSLYPFNSFIPQNNFGAFVDEYQVMSRYGVGDLYDQNHSTTGIAPFEAFKIYLQSKAMYVHDMDYNAAADDFMRHYYGDAYPAINEYYNYIRTYLDYLYNTYGFGKDIMSNVVSTDYWPEEVLFDIYDILEKGVAFLEPLAAKDPERYDTLLSRVRREECFPLYILMDLYFSDLDLSKKREFYDILVTYTKKFNIVCARENTHEVASTLEGWRQSIEEEN